MAGKQVWYPGHSLPEEPARGGRGSDQQHKPSVRAVARAAIIVPQRPAVRTAELLAEDMPVCGYPTVECSSQEQTIIDYSIISTVQNTGLELCGWQNFELPLSRKATPTANNVVRLSTKPSVRGTSLPRQRTASYEFQHFLDLPQQHIEHYRQHYSFSTLSLGNPLQQVGDLDTHPAPVKQDKQSLLKLEVKSLYQGDVYLRELASRLGVIESIREPQLLHSPKHTPASIVKKSRQKVDLTINLFKRGKSSTEEDEGEDSVIPPAAWVTPPIDYVSPSISHPTPLHKSAPPLELPKIPKSVPVNRKQQKNSGSAISITKYLKVTSQGDAGEDEEGSEHSLPNTTTTTSLRTTSDISGGKDLPKENSLSQCSCHGDSLPDVSIVFNCDKVQTHHEQLFRLDRTRKDKIITNKAHSLRLASRHWSTMASFKHPLSSYVSHQQSQQRERTHSRPPRQQKERTHSRPSTQQRERTHSRPPTQQRERTHSRPPTQQRERTHSRPLTQQRERIHSQSPTQQGEGTQSRPLTQQRERTHFQSLTQQRERTHSQQPTQQRERTHSQSPTQQRERTHSQSPTQQRDRTHSRPPTQQRERSHSRPPTQQRSHCQGKVLDQWSEQSSNQEHRRKERPHKSKPRSYSRPQVSVEGNAKLNKLTIIYDSTKQKKSRRANRTDRPSTQTATCGRSQKSRPSTRMGLGCLEESGYWKELPSDQRLQSSKNHRQATQTELRRLVTERSTDAVTPPGATQKQIAQHLARLKRKFVNVVEKQQVGVTL